MALSEIEKLERRYAENPQGLTFAPLAEVHRKNGETQRALDLLRPGLEIHPDYIPASIVLGRCHMDLGDVHAAETAFLHVLALDGENVIALKSLADISERLLKFDDAERWLHTLLSVDRSNDDAREQLQRVEISRRQAGVASSAEPSSVDDPSTLVESSAAVEPPMDIEPPPPPFEPPASQPERAPPMRMEDLEPSALREHFEESAGMQVEEPARLKESDRFEDPVEPIEGLVGREVDAPGRSLDEFRVEMAEDIVLESAGGSEFQMPDASQELSGSGARGERAPFEEDAPVAPSPAWEAPTAKRTEPEEVESTPPALSEPEPYAPEPYAPEPYQPQPFVYVPPREEPAPSAHVSEPPVPEPAASEPRTPEPLAPEPIPAVPLSDFPWQRREEGRGSPLPPAAAPKRSYGVGETGGRSIAQLFNGILSARPPAQAPAAPVRQAPAPGGGAPTRPAADALSLSSVFGEEASETPPAVPASNQGAGSVSFDNFFTSPSASPAARTTRAADPKNDDLDQFHAWLQNLKR